MSLRPDPINWVVGPAKANLGEYAEIIVPEGFRFASAEDARVLLKQMNNPAPKALAGIMAPAFGKWMVVFEFNEIGYVPDNGKERIDSEAVLAKLREKLQHQSEQQAAGSAPSTTVGWELEPRLNRDDHTLEWAIRAENGPVKAVNHVLRVFGRTGALDGIAVQPQTMASDAIPLKQLMSGVTFKSGYTYVDYQKGDKISKLGLADLITADDTVEKKAGVLVWAAASGAAVLAIAGIGLVLFRMKHREPKKTAHSNGPLAALPLRANGTTVLLKKDLDLEHMNGNGNGNGNGHGNGKVNGQKIRRRRIFDYQKYYSDLLFQVSDRTYEMDAPKTRNGESPVKLAPTENGSAHQTTLSANLGLIESQKHLIEEQQRLIREQTKLIEEKTRLIQEKNQVLEKQAELFGNNVF